MQYQNHSGIQYSPTDLIIFLESEFCSWTDRWYLETRFQHSESKGLSGTLFCSELPDSKSCLPDEKDAQLELIAQKGIEHEQSFLQTLKENGHSVSEIKSDRNAAERTFEAMQSGADVIYQALVKHDNLGGYADFLVKIDGASNLGDHHYEVWDTKLSKSPKASFIIQLCAYIDILEQIQSRRGSGFEVVLGDNQSQRFLTQRFFSYYKVFKKNYLRFQDTFDPKCVPFPGHSPSYGRWSSVANQILEASDHLSRVANISRSQVRKLEDAGIQSLEELSKTELTEIPRLPRPVFSRLKSQAKLQTRSKYKEVPCYEVQFAPEETPRRGLASLPPCFSPRRLF